jgi:hypothetical protein
MVSGCIRTACRILRDGGAGARSSVEQPEGLPASAASVSTDLLLGHGTVMTFGLFGRCSRLEIRLSA